MVKKFFLIFVLLMVLASCGYRFAGGGENFDSRIRDIFVETFTNATAEALVETYTRNAFINQFRQGGRFAIAGSSDSADALLSGTIVDIQTSRATYTAADSAVEDRVYMRLDLILQERGGENLWSRSNFSGSEAYRVSDDPGVTERNRTAAMRKLSADLAERAYRSIISGF